MFTVLHMTVPIIWPMTIKVTWVLIWELQINFSKEANLQTQNPWMLRMYYIYYLDICYLTPQPEYKSRESRCFYLFCSLLHLQHPEHSKFLTNIGWANKPEVLFWSDTISCIFALCARKAACLIAKRILENSQPMPSHHKWETKARGGVVSSSRSQGKLDAKAARIS